MVNQAEIIDRIADKTGLYKKDIRKMLSAFKEVVYEVVEEGDELFFKEVFTIKPTDIKGRNRYIVPYKKVVYQDEHKTLKIIPSKLLLNVINGKE